MLARFEALWPILWHFAGASGIILALLLLAWYFPGIRTICIALAIGFAAWLGGYTMGVKNEHTYTVAALAAQKEAYNEATAKLVAQHAAEGAAARAAAEKEIPPLEPDAVPAPASGVRNDKRKSNTKSH